MSGPSNIETEDSSGSGYKAKTEPVKLREDGRAAIKQPKSARPPLHKPRRLPRRHAGTGDAATASVAGSTTAGKHSVVGGEASIADSTVEGEVSNRDSQRSKHKDKRPFVKAVATVLWDYKAEHDDEIDVLKGYDVTISQEEYSKRSGTGREHRWKWMNVERYKQKGWIPASYLELKRHISQTPAVYTGTWFIGEQDQLAARNRLTEPDARRGMFVICAPPEYQQQHLFSMAVRFTDEERPLVKTYKILRDAVGRCYMQHMNKARFPHLYALVRHLCTKSDKESLVSMKLRGGPPLKEGQKLKEPPPPPRRPLRGDLSNRESGPVKTSMVSYKISLKDLIYEERDVLGKGNFGVVYKGYYRYHGEDVPVAVKEIFGTGEDSTEEFMQEAQILVLLQHRNLVRFYGWYASKGHMIMVMEHMDKGALDKFVRGLIMEKNPLSEAAQTDVCYQVAAGMKYMEQRKVVHRDLAARNCLVSHHGQDTILIKVTDFGLARAVTKAEYYRSRKVSELPFKWMAIESLTHRLFTTKSDVWAFGILMYEVSTHGGQPYLELQNDEMNDFLSQGNRLERPPEMSETLYAVAKSCWVHEAKDRPSFAQLYAKFDQMLYERC